MAYQAPIHALSIAGRTASERLVDRALFNSLFVFLPSESETAAQVVEFFEQQMTAGLADALGGEALIKNQIEANAAHTLLTDLELEKAVFEELRRDASVHDPESVRKEVQHVRFEVVRHWLESILVAWRLWGNAQQHLRIDSLLSPIEVPRAAAEEWDNWNNSARAYLQGNVALNEQALIGTQRTFALNLMNETSARPIGIPRRLALKHGVVVPRNLN